VHSATSATSFASYQSIELFTTAEPKQMKAQELQEKLQGVIAFPVTPFKADLSLDVEGLRRNIQLLMQHPLAAIVAAGGTGELYSLTASEHLAVVKAIVEEVGGRVPVISGTGFNLPIAIQLAQQAAQLKVDATLALPPYYPNADDEALAEYYAAIGAATPLPLIVYSRDWVNPSPAWVEELADKIPTLAAWKDGQGDIRRYQQIMHRLGDRLHWIGGAGDDCVPGYYSIGIRVYTSSIATIAPRLSLQLHEAAASGNSTELNEIMQRYVIPLYALRMRRKGYEVTVMKEMMNQAGLAAGPVRPPLPSLRADEIKEVAAMVKDWQVVLSLDAVVS
jgi:5-dehydro-4-deoxyglucarate dehydratase